MISEEQLFFEPKKTVEDHLRLKIPTGLTPKTIFADGYCTWEELLNVKGPLPTDIVQGISWDEEEPDPDSGITLILVVSRNREETDEEYLNRLEREAGFRKSAEDYEKREYERLKAKYETK